MIKKTATLTFTLLFAFSIVNAQQQLNQTTKIDTIESYVGIVISSGPNGYFVNEQPISRKMYEYYKNALDRAIRCRPCWIKNFNVEEQLVSEGLYYGECPIGKKIDYYSTGKVKTIGFYMPVDKSNLNEWYKNAACNKDSIWTYYDPFGRLLRKELYKNGKLIQ
jgi:hypothetical protein